jgi:hypothetical protein
LVYVAAEAVVTLESEEALEVLGIDSNLGDSG